MKTIKLEGSPEWTKVADWIKQNNYPNISRQHFTFEPRGLYIVSDYSFRDTTLMLEEAELGLITIEKYGDWNYVYERYLDMWVLWVGKYWYYITRHF